MLTIEVRKRCASSPSTRRSRSQGVTVVVGPSGSGKSTLLGLIAGLVRESGRITLDGRVLSTIARSSRPTGVTSAWSFRSTRSSCISRQNVAFGLRAWVSRWASETFAWRACSTKWRSAAWRRACRRALRWTAPAVALRTGAVIDPVRCWTSHYRARSLDASAVPRGTRCAVARRTFQRSWYPRRS